MKLKAEREAKSGNASKRRKKKRENTILFVAHCSTFN